MLGCSIEKAKEVCWQKGNPSLSEALTIAKTCKYSRRNLKREMFEVAKMRRYMLGKPIRKGRKVTYNRAKANKLKGDQKFQGTYRCGEYGHVAINKDCIGWKAKCKKCGQKGHVSKCCRSGNIKKQVQEALYNAESDDGKEDNIVLQGMDVEDDGPFESVCID